MTTPTTGAAELPEALRLAECLERDCEMNWPDYDNQMNAAAELRRLHAQVSALSAAQAGVPAQNVPQGVLQAIKAAGMHLIRGIDDVYCLIPAMNATAQCDGGTCGIGGYCEACPKQAAPAQPGQEGELKYPPLPDADGWLKRQDGSEVLGYGPAKLLAYVDADRAARAAPQPATADAVDAARYRWLRHGDNDEKVLCNGPVVKDYWYLLRGEKLDAAIDAALAAQRATHQGDHK